MGGIDNRSLDLNVLAARLEEAFREWVQLDPLASRPQFSCGPVGPDPGLPRFGTEQLEETSDVTIDPTLKDVFTAVVLREVIRTFIPLHCRVDITDDAINRFCGFFLKNTAAGQIGSYNSPHWQGLIKNHTRQYVVHYLGSPITVDLDSAPYGLDFFRVFVRKLRQYAPLITPEQSNDIIPAIISFISVSLWGHTYSREQAEFIALVSDYMGKYPAFPIQMRIAESKPGWALERCERISRGLEGDPVSPTYMPNPGMLGLTYFGIIIETPPAVGSYVVRQMAFLPFATTSFSQWVGAPLPTYFSINFLAPAQVDELGAYLASLKHDGFILDYQIYRVERFVDIVNWNETLAVDQPPPLITATQVEWRSNPTTQVRPLDSWFIQQALPWFGLRQYVPRALTALDPERNYRSFLPIIQDAALLTTADLGKTLAVVAPLLERFRNVEYVSRMLAIGTDLLRYLFDHPEIEHSAGADWGKLGLPWRYFPARDWVLERAHAAAGNAAQQGILLSSLSLAARVLQFFAPFTIPPGVPIFEYLGEKQQSLSHVIQGEIAKVPDGEQARLQYFTDIHDNIVSDRLVVPRIILSPMFQPIVEDFYLLARSPRSWSDLVADFKTRFETGIHHCYLMQFHDQAGNPLIGGVVRATRTQFQSFRRGLVGARGVLGMGASLLVGRRVPMWGYYRRDFIETYDITGRSYAPLKDYLALVRAEHLVGWVRPRASPLPYARKILAEPYLGPVERLTRPPPNVVHLTPKLVTDLKASFLSGTPAPHNLVSQRLQARVRCDLNWPAYGLERYFLLVFLSTRQPKYIFTHLITPATRRVLVSSAVSGFQTVLIEYLWPKDAPDDHFLQYLYSRTEKDVLAYSVHRVLSDARFFNLDKAGVQDTIEKLDSVDLRIFMLAHATNPEKTTANEHSYGGAARHAPGSAGWELALEYFSDSKRHGKKSLPPDSWPEFEFDPRTLGFSEKVALVFRGHFDALPLCQSLPFGHYYRTEEVYYSTSERLVGQPGHVILFDFPTLQVSHLDAVLDDILRDPAVIAYSVSSYLVEQNLALVQGVALARINPLRSNLYDFAGGQYVHLPKRQLRDGKWHTLSLMDQLGMLNKAWSSTSRRK